MYKLCSCCKLEKAVAEFSKCKRNKDGLQTQCKGCVKQYNKKWNKANVDKIKQYSKKNYDKIRQYNKQWFEDNVGYTEQYYKANADKMKQYMKQYHIDNPTHNYDSKHSIPPGVYEILYKGIRKYVGQSKIPYERIKGKHFSKLSNPEHTNSPVSYKLSIGEIQRKDLSFNMLEFEDDKQRREEIEQRYIDNSTGLWNVIGQKY